MPGEDQSPLPTGARSKGEYHQDDDKMEENNNTTSAALSYQQQQQQQQQAIDNTVKGSDSAARSSNRGSKKEATAKETQMSSTPSQMAARPIAKGRVLRPVRVAVAVAIAAAAQDDDDDEEVQSVQQQIAPPSPLSRARASIALRTTRRAIRSQSNTPGAAAADYKNLPAKLRPSRHPYPKGESEETNRAPPVFKGSQKWTLYYRRKYPQEYRRAMRGAPSPDRSGGDSGVERGSMPQTASTTTIKRYIAFGRGGRDMWEITEDLPVPKGMVRVPVPEGSKRIWPASKAQPSSPGQLPLLPWNQKAEVPGTHKEVQQWYRPSKQTE